MSIYDEIGGREGVAVAVDTFYDHVMADDMLAPYFAATDMPRQKRHLRTFLGGLGVAPATIGAIGDTLVPLRSRIVGI